MPYKSDPDLRDLMILELVQCLRDERMFVRIWNPTNRFISDVAHGCSKRVGVDPFVAGSERNRVVDAAAHQIWSSKNSR